jgi:hypothetical protein
VVLCSSVSAMEHPTRSKAPSLESRAQRGMAEAGAGRSAWRIGSRGRGDQRGEHDEVGARGKQCYEPSMLETLDVGVGTVDAAALAPARWVRRTGWCGGGSVVRLVALGSEGSRRTWWRGGSRWSKEERAAVLSLLVDRG